MKPTVTTATHPHCAPHADTPYSRISTDRKRQIRRALDMDYPVWQVARMFKVSHNNVVAIRRTKPSNLA